MKMLVECFILRFSEWLSRNLKKAKKNQTNHEAIVQKTRNVEAIVTQATDVDKILWSNQWSYTQFRACLHGFQRLYEKHGVEFHLQGTCIFLVLSALGLLISLG